MIVAKLDPVDEFTTLAIREDLSPKAQSRVFADFARRGIEDAKRSNARVLKRVPRVEVTVDGRTGARLESVKPDGVIVAEFQLVDDVLRVIAQMLVDRSPVRSGRYLKGHKIFADGRQIAVRGGEAVPPAASYTLLNDVPYARKIEIGRTRAGRAFVIQVEPRIYERTARDARRRFGNLAEITFGFAAPIGGAIVGAGAAGERAARVPAITIKPR